MKSSRVLVAVLAVLCLSAVSHADVIDVTGANWHDVSGWDTSTTDMYVGSDVFLYGQYASANLTAALTNPAVSIVSAKLVYSRGYCGGNGPTLQGTMTVGEPKYDYTPDTGDYNTDLHRNLVGGDEDNPVLPANRTCSAIEVVHNPAAYFGPYQGTQSVDITAIVQDWKNGATSFNYSLNLAFSPFTLDLYSYARPDAFGEFAPYIEVVTAPAIPEPVTMSLLFVGGIATLLRRRRSA